MSPHITMLLQLCGLLSALAFGASGYGFGYGGSFAGSGLNLAPPAVNVRPNVVNLTPAPITVRPNPVAVTNGPSQTGNLKTSTASKEGQYTPLYEWRYHRVNIDQGVPSAAFRLRCQYPGKVDLEVQDTSVAADILIAPDLTTFSVQRYNTHTIASVNVVAWCEDRPFTAVSSGLDGNSLVLLPQAPNLSANKPLAQ